MSLYNLSNVSAANNPLDFIIGINQLSGSWFGIMMYVTVVLIFFLSMKSRWTTEQSMATTSFVCLILALIFRVLDLIPDFVMWLGIIFAAGTLAWLYLKE